MLSDQKHMQKPCTLTMVYLSWNTVPISFAGLRGERWSAWSRRCLLHVVFIMSVCWSVHLMSETICWPRAKKRGRRLIVFCALQRKTIICDKNLHTLHSDLDATQSLLFFCVRNVMMPTLISNPAVLSIDQQISREEAFKIKRCQEIQTTMTTWRWDQHRT